jgi:hypothetical protein
MAGHVVFWIIAAVVATVCFGRAWKVGVGGLDDAGNIKNIFKYQGSEMWMAIGAGFAIFALVDMFMLFNPPPPSINGGPAR